VGLMTTTTGTDGDAWTYKCVFVQLSNG